MVLTSSVANSQPEVHANFFQQKNVTRLLLIKDYLLQLQRHPPVLAPCEPEAPSFPGVLGPVQHEGVQPAAFAGAAAVEDGANHGAVGQVYDVLDRLSTEQKGGRGVKVKELPLLLLRLLFWLSLKSRLMNIFCYSYCQRAIQEMPRAKHYF